MLRVGRLAGAIVAEIGDAHDRVGNPKPPCDWYVRDPQHRPELD